MKIKTITCHDVYNSGASLQAYALQTYLEQLGHDVEIIDYKPDYLSRHFDFTEVSNPKWNTNFIFRVVYLILKFPERVKSLSKKRAFDQFTRRYLKLTPNRYSSNKKLKDNLPKADIYIAGSDQIWNTLFQNGKDPAFYLDFVPESKIKASYAASFATDDVVEEYKIFVSKLIKRLDYVSVRESDAISILTNLGIQDSTWVCDPVFLLPADKWCKLTESYHFTEDYILIYDFEYNPLIKEIAKYLAEKHNWKIYCVNLHLSYADKSFKYASPQEFVALIRDAKYIISNSFHATAFSIIFQKEFYIVPRKEGINTRMLSLVTYLGLQERMGFFNMDSFQNMSPILYSSLRSKLDRYIDNSKLYLNKVISK